MMVNTTAEVPMDSDILRSYFKRLVNHFFKILPMRENDEETLNTYMRSLQVELLGCQNLIIALKDNSSYLTILAILQYLIDNPECSIAQVRREVFRAISICNKLQAEFATKEVS